MICAYWRSTEALFITYAVISELSEFHTDQEMLKKHKVNMGGRAYGWGHREDREVLMWA